MELTNLRLIRNPRAESAVGEHVTLTSNQTQALASEIQSRTVRVPRSTAGGERRHFARDEEIAARAATWQSTAPDPLAITSGDAAPASPVESLVAAIGDANRWLQSRADDPVPEEFAAFRAGTITAAAALFDEAATLLADWIATELAGERRFERLGYLTRLRLVLDVLDQRVLSDSMLTADNGRHAVRDALYRRSLFVAAALTGAPEGEPLQLVRDAKVSDLFVVRSEWSCYKAGEVASIRNVLGGESLEHEIRQTREEETITREERERLEQSEQSEEDRTQSELTREVQRSTSREVNAEGSVDVSGQYGLTKYAASARVAASAALAETTRQASRIARDLISKAVARVESRTREERVTRLLTKSDDFTRHTIDNKDGAHLRGIYRWVDRVDRLQMFRFPDRLHLEFQIPEPGEYVRFRLANPSAASGVAAPPPFDVTVDAITRDNYATLAAAYRAGTLPAPPDETISVTSVVNGTMAQDPPKSTTKVWNMPRIEKTSEIAIPEGYGATTLKYAAVAIPLRAVWRVEGTNLSPVNHRKYAEGFHHVSLTVLAGGGLHRSEKGAEVLKDFTVQMSNLLDTDSRSSVLFEDAILQVPLPAHGKPAAMTIDFDDAVTEKVSVGVQAAGASSVSVSFEVNCRLQPVALREWQHSVYDTLLDAWRGWQQEWRTAQLQRLGPGLSAVDGTSPARNRQTIQEEFKRQVITWLLNDAGFSGVVAMQERPDNWDAIDLAAARSNAAVIQFLEQAFEWGNLSYVCYPYYWARGDNWRDLADLEGADPNFVAFLRAGSARVVVPARPGFERAVLHWLVYQEPFLGDPLPLPDDPLYVSIATEIHDLTAGPPGGEPGESWETVLSTSLMWLDKKPDLPANDRPRLGKPPNEPIDSFCSEPTPD